MVPNLIAEVFGVRGLQSVDATECSSELLAQLYDVLLVTFFTAQKFNSWLEVVMESLSEIVPSESARLVEVLQWVCCPNLMLLLQTDKIFRWKNVKAMPLLIPHN